MSWRVRYYLWQERRRLAPRPRFQRALKERLAVVARERYGERPRWRWRYRLVRLASGALAGVIGVASVSTGAYAYVSPEVTPASALYPVKHALERVAERWPRSDEKQARFYARQLERREAEAQVAAMRGESSERIAERIEQIEQRLVAIAEKLAATQKPLPVPARVRLERKQERLEKKYQQLLDRQSGPVSIPGTAKAGATTATPATTERTLPSSARSVPWRKNNKPDSDLILPPAESAAALRLGAPAEKVKPSSPDQSTKANQSRPDQEKPAAPSLVPTSSVELNSVNLPDSVASDRRVARPRLKPAGRHDDTAKQIKKP
ncbi:MAG: hypothetical protein HYV42_02660 [Candidatus Magasanikbacteria bacterium]|nr:hypothetical protein [Candidatus Magasanikbacteria bacterium]